MVNGNPVYARLKPGFGHYSSRLEEDVEKLAPNLEKEEGHWSNKGDDMSDIPKEMENGIKEIFGRVHDSSAPVMEYAGILMPSINLPESNESAQDPALESAEIFIHSLKWQYHEKMVRKADDGKADMICTERPMLF